MNIKPYWPVIIFSTLYLLIGGAYFLVNNNSEFIIYIVVIVAILGGVFASLKYTKFPVWMLWLLSFWGLMHVLGGAVDTSDGVLFAYRIYPFIDFGGDFYILKYDQMVHGYLYGLVAVMAYHSLQTLLHTKKSGFALTLVSVLVSLGISSLNEIMEFLISLKMVNGVGGYENTMLDLCFNFAGALVGVVIYLKFRKKM